MKKTMLFVLTLTLNGCVTRARFNMGVSEAYLRGGRECWKTCQEDDAKRAAFMLAEAKDFDSQIRELREELTYKNERLRLLRQLNDDGTLRGYWEVETQPVTTPEATPLPSPFDTPHATEIAP